MIKVGKIPSQDEAFRMMSEAEIRNPGPWVEHSRYVAQAAKLIASCHRDLDPPTAYILGYLHDIGRQEGVTDMRHVLDGYTYLHDRGFIGAAQICMTHSFPIKTIHAGSGKWDCTPEELVFIEDYLLKVEYTAYDRLIQLCDSVVSPTGYCLMEKRLVDVILRHGVNDYTMLKWKAFYEIKEEFERAIGKSIYAILPGVVANTFGDE